jgi:hypothetical protein
MHMLIKHSASILHSDISFSIFDNGRNIVDSDVTTLFFAPLISLPNLFIARRLDVGDVEESSYI